VEVTNPEHCGARRVCRPGQAKLTKSPRPRGVRRGSESAGDRGMCARRSPEQPASGLAQCRGGGGWGSLGCEAFLSQDDQTQNPSSDHALSSATPTTDPTRLVLAAEAVRDSHNIKPGNLLRNEA